MSIQCALRGSAGFRCVTGIFDIIRTTLDQFDFFSPAFSTIRGWVLKIGLANLTLPKEVGKWIWIIDVSIQMGAMKCVLILGVNMDRLKEKKDYVLSHSDVEPIILKTVESCPGEVIRDALIEAKEKTGGSIAILSDEGSEMKRGVRLYAQTTPVIHSHDILHKMDLVLKKELESDEVWKKFTRQMTDSIQRLKLTSSAHLVPPKQRQKKRLRGEIKMIEWGVKIIRHLSSDKASDQQKEILSWIFDYEFILKSYQEMGCIFDLIVSEVRRSGYYQGVSQVIEQKCSQIVVVERSQNFFRKALEALKEEENKVSEGIPVLGSSEIIESTFGKFKQLEKNHSSGGLTSLVLSLPAMVGQLSNEFIKMAMEQISIGKVNEWIGNNLGSTFWSRRREDLGCNQNSVQHEEILNACDYLELDDLLAVSYS